MAVAGGQTLLNTTFTTSFDIWTPAQAYPDSYPGGSNPPETGAVEVGTLGYTHFFNGTTQSADSVYRITLTFPHTDASVTVNFTGLMSGTNDEFWGLDNVTVETLPEGGVPKGGVPKGGDPKEGVPKGGDGDDVPPGRNAERDVHGEKRSNETHESTNDPDARLYRKGNGRESRLCYMGHALMQNRNGLVVAGALNRASGTAEGEAALEMLGRLRPGRRRIAPRRITLGADKAYDVTAFVGDLRARKITPHIAIDGHLTKTGKRRKTAIDGRTTGHAGYAVSQRRRKRIEEVFGWIKPSAGQAKTKFRGVDRVR